MVKELVSLMLLVLQLSAIQLSNWSKVSDNFIWKRTCLSTTHTRLLALFPGPTRHQKSKTNLDFAGARDSEWQWHQLGRMQVCTSLQTDNHASTSPLSFFTGRMPFLPPNQQCKNTEGRNMLKKTHKHLHLKAYHRKTTNHLIHNRHH